MKTIPATHLPTPTAAPCVLASACTAQGTALNRRRFMRLALTSGAWCLGGRYLSGAAEAAGDLPPLPPVPKCKLFVFYAGGPGAWPKPEFDAAAARVKYDKYIQGLSAKFPDVQLVGRDTAKDGATVEEIRKSGADGVLCIKIGGSTPTFALESGLPLAIWEPPFTLHDWMYISEHVRAGKPLAHIPSRNLADIDFLVSLLKATAQMRRSKILLVSARAVDRAKTIKAQFGCDITEITTDQAVQAHRRVDEKLASALAERLFLKPARRIVEPTRQEIIKSTKMYVAMRRMLADHRAQAITVNCLGGMPIDVLGYPCLGFCQLCDEGYPGACEADLESTLTMLMFQYAVNKPGFITDPLFDLSRNAVIHAHCVAPTRMDGPQGERHPFTIRTHRDDNRGASMDVGLRVGEVITCAKTIDDKAILISTGKIVEGRVPEFDDAGCRTQITVEVQGSAQKMLENWSRDITQDRNIRNLLHRVVFYGDHTRMVHYLAKLMRLKVVPEC